MKHLISLAFKYMKRQKLRSTLTFLCITLAVFTMNTFAAYFSSIRATLINQCIEENGAWEINISKLLGDCPDQEVAADIIANHAVVSDHNLSTTQIAVPLMERNANGDYLYYTLEVGDSAPMRLTELRHVRHVSGATSGDYPDFPEVSIPDGAAIVPGWLADYGYQVGDTVTITLRPMCAKADESDPLLIGLRETLAAIPPENGIPVIADDPTGLQPSMNGEDGYSYITMRLYDWFVNEYEDEEFPLCDERSGNPVTLTFTIHDFDYHATENHWFKLETGYGDSLDLSPLFSLDAFTIGDSVPTEDCMMFWEESNAFIRIHDHVKDFEAAQEALLKDLGKPGTEFYTYFPPMDETVFHQELLGFEAKGANAITYMLAPIVLTLLLTLLVWAISRFVIDNAFEISIKERTSQFAVLRIMGASRGQLLALVFTETLFYCVTALPLGIFSAFGLCKLVFTSFHRVGFTVFEFHFDPLVTFIGIFLCVAAICISTYTSAMWAARNLSPLEALNFGMRKQKAGRLRHRKSRLNLGASGFVTRYTLRNIAQNKGRFLISTVALSLGVLMFIFCALVALLGGRMLQYEANSQGLMCDFSAAFYSNDTEARDFAPFLEQHLNDNEAVEDWVLYRNAYFTLAESSPDFADVLPEYPLYGAYGGIRPISRSEFDRYLAESVDFSFDELQSSGEGLLFYPTTGNVNYDDMSDFNPDGTPKEIYDPSYTPIDMAPLQFDSGGEVTLRGVVCAAHPIWGYASILVPFDTFVPLQEANEHTGLSTSAYITLSDKDAYEPFKTQLEELTVEFEKEYGGTCYWYDYFAACTGRRAFLGTIVTVVLVFLISIWSVGVLTMVNSINTSVLNRKRELAMLRSVGMTKQQLANSVCIESTMYAAISTGLGLFAGIAAFFYLMEMYSKYIDSMMIVYLGTSIFGVVAVTLLLNLLIARLAALPGIRTVRTLA